MELDFEKIIDDGGARAWRIAAALPVAIDHPGLRVDPVEESVALLPDGPPADGETNATLPLADIRGEFFIRPSACVPNSGRFATQ